MVARFGTNELFLLAMGRYSLLATRENRWAASVCTEDGSELSVVGPKVAHGDVSTTPLIDHRSLHKAYRARLQTADDSDKWRVM